MKRHTNHKHLLMAYVVGALLAPQLAAVGAIAALITHGTLAVEKVSDEESDSGPGASAS